MQARVLAGLTQATWGGSWTPVSGNLGGYVFTSPNLFQRCFAPSIHLSLCGGGGWLAEHGGFELALGGRPVTLL